MAAETLTPRCEVSGLPLPVLPEEPREIGVLSFPRKPNWHHHFHPSTEPLLLDMGGKAVRSSRVQSLATGLHNGYHMVFTGPELPSSENDKFKQAVLAATNVVPRQAIRMHDTDNWEVIELDDEHYQRVGSSIRVEQPRKLGRFFAHYASRQEIENEIDERLIEEFLHFKTPAKRRRELASFILGEALDFSVESLSLPDSHQTLKKEGFIPVKKPKTPYSVAKEYVRRRHLPYFEDLMSDRLATL